MRKRLKAVGAQVQKLRNSKALTQAGLAEKADLSTNYVGQIERGQANATLPSLIAIADALEVNPSELLAPLDKTPRDSILALQERIQEIEQATQDVKKKLEGFL